MIWDVDPVAIHTSEISIRWYGIFLSAALLAGFVHLRWLIAQAGQAALFDDIAVWGFIGGIIGARLGHFAFYEPGVLFSQPLVMLTPGVPGLAGHGAIIGVCIAMGLLSCRHRPFPYTLVLATFALSYVVFCVVIRIGNFFNSELVGTPTGAPWGIIFTWFDAAPRHPVQLYESLSYLLVYPGLAWVYRHMDKLGSFAATLSVMSALRIVLEAFKEKQSLLEADTTYTLGQILTIPLLMLGLILLAVSLRRQASSSI